MKQKYIATLLGCGIGDTLGMAVEGWKKQQIEKYVGRVTNPIAPVLLHDNQGNLIKEDEFGKLGYYTRDLSKGEYTDDTILTLAIAESIVEKQKLDLEDISKKQVEAYNVLIEPSGHVRGGFGRTTKQAFENMKKGISPFRSGISPGLGDGPPMKMAPIGMYMHATGEYEQGLRTARLIGRSTHLDERAIAAGVVQAHAIFSLLNNPTKREFLGDLLISSIENEKFQNYEALAEKGNLTEKISWIRKNQDATDEQALKHLKNSALAFETYPFSIFMFQKYWKNPIQGLVETVNFGGDCDTTGAIYGTLAGAKNGMIFPKKWENVLQGSEKLINVAEEIYKLGEK